MSNNKAFKSGIWYTVSNFLIRSIGLITTPVFTRLLSKSEFGAFNNYIAWLGILSIFITLNLDASLISARYDYRDRLDEYILSILVLNMFSVGAWFIILNIFSDVACFISGLPIAYINIMLVYLFFLPAINLFQEKERYYFEYKKTVITSLIYAVGTTVTSVLLVLIFDDRLVGRILGMVIPTVVLGGIFGGYFIKKGKRVRIVYWKYAITICFPYIMHLFAGTLLSTADRTMIDRWCGSEATALYSLAYNCGAIVTLLLNSMNDAFAPWLGEKLSEKKYNEIRKYSTYYISFFLFVALGIMLVSPEVLLILGGKTYMEAVYVLAPVSMGCVCQFVYTLFVNIEQFQKKTSGMAMATVVAAGINVGLNMIFIPRIGYLAAAYTTLVGYMCLLAIHMYLVWKIGLSVVYDYRFVVKTICVGLIAMTLVILSYSVNVIRYIAIGVYCLTAVIILLKIKETVIRIIKRKKV